MRSGLALSGRASLAFLRVAWRRLESVSHNHPAGYRPVLRLLSQSRRSALPADRIGSPGASQPQLQSRHRPEKYCQYLQLVYACAHNSPLLMRSRSFLQQFYLFREEEKAMARQHALIPLLSTGIVVECDNQIEALLKVLLNGFNTSYFLFEQKIKGVRAHFWMQTHAITHARIA